jgi:hypothetical protein
MNTGPHHHVEVNATMGIDSNTNSDIVGKHRGGILETNKSEKKVSIFRINITKRNIQYKIHRIKTKNSEKEEKTLIKLIKRKLAKYKQKKIE